MDIKKEINSKSLSNLQELLKSLKLYRDLIWKLWNRWKLLFDSISNNKSIYKLEYFEGLSEKEALLKAQEAYKKVFWEEIAEEQIILKSKKTLEWWIKVFRDDEMVDLSFNRIKKYFLNN